MTQVLVLVSAFAALILGLYVLQLSFGRLSAQFERANLVAWVLIAMFPVLLIFSFFPESGASGKVVGFSVTGSFAGFILLFLLGTRRSLTAKHLDDVRQELEARDAEIQALKDQSAAHARRPQVIGDTRRYLYTVDDCPGKQIGLVTGNLNMVKFASIWVNSENTNMQMSRFFEDTISATIRYLGSKRDERGTVVKDCIGDELKAKMNASTSVPPGHVLDTGPGELATSHKVKKLYHVAAVHGQLAVGYRQIPDVGVCVSNALERADQEQWSPGEAPSIIFPLLGAGSGRGSPEATMRTVLGAALNHLSCHADCPIEVVYFLAFTDVELETFTKVLQSEPQVSAVPPVGARAAQPQDRLKNL